MTRGLPGGDSDPPAWGRWLRQIGGEATGGMTLMQGVGKSPLLVLSRVDKGRVALLLSDQMWLWARDFDGGGPYLDLLRRLAHWLMKEPDLEEEALRARAKGRELTIERQSVKGEIPQATITGPDGKTTIVQLASVAPGLSRAMLSVDEDGLYRASDGEHIALAVVGPQNPLEFQEVVSNPEKLQAARRGDRGRRASSGAGRRRSDHAAAHRRDGALAELFRRRLYRREADGRERADRRVAAPARRRPPRPGAAAGRPGVDVAARGRHARLKPQPLIVRSVAKRRVANDAGGSEGGTSP